MEKNKKIILGILTISPLVLLFLFVPAFFIITIGASTRGHEMPVFFDGIPAFFMIFYAVAMLLSFLQLGLLIYYIIHAVNNKNFTSNDRLVWILVLIFANGLGNVIYWFLHIRKDPKQEISEMRRY